MSNITRFDPLAEIRSLQDQFFGNDWFTPLKGIQMPTTDVYVENDKNLIVEAHLPHFEEKDITIEVQDGYLVIQAERHEKDEDKTKKYVVRESSSSFYRRVRLPDVADSDKIDAHMSKGVLKISVPYKSLPEPKRIQIKKK